MLSFFKKLGKLPIILIAGAIAILLMLYAQMAFLQYLPENSPGYMALQLSISVERFSEVLDIWGPENTLRYQHSMWADFLFPLSYATLFTGLLVWIGRHREHSQFEQSVWFAPMLAALMDYVENILHLVLLTKGEPYSPQLVLFSSNVAMVKWVLLGGVIPITLVWATAQTLFRKNEK
jgi:hypothetical protein